MKAAKDKEGWAGPFERLKFSLTSKVRDNFTEESDKQVLREALRSSMMRHAFAASVDVRRILRSSWTWRRSGERPWAGARRAFLERGRLDPSGQAEPSGCRG